MRILRLVAGNVAILLGLLLVCALLGELVLRARPRPNESEHDDGETKHRFTIYQPDGTLDYVHRPDWEAVQQNEEFLVAAHINALGLRGPAVAPEKPPGVYRVLVVGDSFAFGWGVEDEEALPARLAELLTAPPGAERVEVLNAGVAGWSAAHYWLYLRERGFALDPDLVLLVPSENDLSDLAALRFELDDRNLPVRITSTLRMIDESGRMRYLDESHLGLPRVAFPGQRWLSDHTVLYHWLRYRLSRVFLSFFHERAEARMQREAGSPPKGAIETLAPAEVQRGVHAGREFQLRYHRYLMARIAAACAARGIEFRTLLVTRRDAPSEPESVAGQRGRSCDADERCRTSREFLSEISERDAFFAIDGHWRPAGHEAVARGVASWLGADAQGP